MDEASQMPPNARTLAAFVAHLLVGANSLSLSFFSVRSLFVIVSCRFCMLFLAYWKVIDTANFASLSSKFLYLALTELFTSFQEDQLTLLFGSINLITQKREGSVWF